MLLYLDFYEHKLFNYHLLKKYCLFFLIYLAILQENFLFKIIIFKFFLVIK